MSSIIDHSRRISINNTQYTVEYLVNEYLPDNTGTLFLPESQRNWAWNGKRGLAKMQSLVDSVFMGYPIPSLILNTTRRSGGRAQIYDGRHRIETLYNFFVDKFRWRGKLFSELCQEDTRIFLERTIPVTITCMASNNDLAEMFMRLNAGVPLKDSDLFWANRHTPFVDAVDRLVCKNDRLSLALGNLKMRNRPDLSNWVALVAGLHTNNAGNMTRSYVRVCAEIGLETMVDERSIRANINTWCKLLEDANEAYPTTDAEKRKLKTVGSVAAPFFGDLMNPDNADKRDEILAKWLGIIGRLRGADDVRKPMKLALHAPGEGNMTHAKINTIISQVNRYLETGGIDGDVDEMDDEEDESV